MISGRGHHEDRCRDLARQRRRWRHHAFRHPDAL